MFIYDMDGTWKAMSIVNRTVINDDTNTRVIIDNIFRWSNGIDTTFCYLQCQLIMCRSQNLSLELKTCIFFPDHLEFFGKDVCCDGNRPTQSKMQINKLKDLRNYTIFI